MTDAHAFSIDISGMSCGACVASVEKVTSRIEAVADVSVNLGLSKARVELKAESNVSKSQRSHDVQNVSKMIVERSPHPDGRVFLGSSGSEAKDTGFKIARVGMQQRREAERQIIVKRTNGYHGTNFGGTSAQGIAPNREGWGDLVPHFIEVPHDDLEAAAQIFAEHGDRIAAVLTCLLYTSPSPRD